VLQPLREAIHRVVAAFFVNIDGFQAIALAQDFARRMRHGMLTARDLWLARVVRSSLSAFQRFAKRLWEDYDTVKAGVALP
jgi:transposase